MNLHKAAPRSVVSLMIPVHLLQQQQQQQQLCGSSSEVCLSLQCKEQTIDRVSLKQFFLFLSPSDISHGSRVPATHRLWLNHECKKRTTHTHTHKVIHTKQARH